MVSCLGPLYQVLHKGLWGLGALHEGLRSLDALHQRLRVGLSKGRNQDVVLLRHPMTSSSCVILCMHRTRSAHISQHLHSTHSSYACDNAMQQRLQENDGTARTGSDGNDGGTLRRTMRLTRQLGSRGVPSDEEGWEEEEEEEEGGDQERPRKMPRVVAGAGGRDSGRESGGESGEEVYSDADEAAGANEDYADEAAGANEDAESAGGPEGEGEDTDGEAVGNSFSQALPSPTLAARLSAKRDSVPSGGRKRTAETDAMVAKEESARASPPKKQVKRELFLGGGSREQENAREAERKHEEMETFLQEELGTMSQALRKQADAHQTLANKVLGATSGLAFEIRELAGLKAQGLLTASEFTSAKAKLFNT